MGADPIAATRAVTANLDEATRMKAARAVLRVAVRLACQITVGAVDENVEEIDFHDGVERELATYIKLRRVGTEAGRAYRGATARVHAVADKLMEEAIAAELAKGNAPHPEPTAAAPAENSGAFVAPARDDGATLQDQRATGDQG